MKSRAPSAPGRSGKSKQPGRPGKPSGSDRGRPPARPTAPTRPARTEQGQKAEKPARFFKSDRGPKGSAHAGGDKREQKQRGGRPGEREHAPSRAVSPFSPQTFLVEGRSALAEYLRFRPESLKEVRCTPAQRRELETLLEKHESALPIQEREIAKDDEERVASVSARVELQALALHELMARLPGRTRDVLLALDHVQDPRNLGAIVRTAAFFGIREIIVPERRQVLLTQSAVATAQGGFALTDLVCVVNLSRTLTELKDQGYWIIGTDMDGEAFGAVAGEYEKVVLVLGSEESGLGKNIRAGCDRAVAIKGADTTLESLNVSVAAGIILQAFTAPRAP